MNAPRSPLSAVSARMIMPSDPPEPVSISSFGSPMSATVAPNPASSMIGSSRLSTSRHDRADLSGPSAVGPLVDRRSDAPRYADAARRVCDHSSPPASTSSAASASVAARRLAASALNSRSRAAHAVAVSSMSWSSGPSRRCTTHAPARPRTHPQPAAAPTHQPPRPGAARTRRSPPAPTPPPRPGRGCRWPPPRVDRTYERIYPQPATHPPSSTPTCG